MDGDRVVGWSIGTAIAWIVIIGVVGCLAGCPQYNVYQKRLDGEAELTRAESTRRVAVLEAKAKEDAASSLANAEVIRAQGVAKANQIIGDSLKGNDAYLRYLWIDKMEGTRSQTIYVPTEAGLPILEAHRLAMPSPSK